MKLLVIFVIACLAIYQTQADSLKNALGMPEAHELDQVDNDFAGSLLDSLTNLLDRILSSTGGISEAAQRVLDGFLELIQKFKIELGSRLKGLLETIRNKIDFEPLKKLLAKLLGKPTSTDSPAENGIENDEEIVEEMMKHILDDITSHESLEKLRAYVENLAKTSKLDVVHALRSLLTKLDNSELKELIKSILSETSVEKRGIMDYLDKIKTLIKDFGLNILEKFKPFVNWVISKWNDLKEGLSGKVGIIKAIAQELLKHGKDVSKIVAEEAKDFLSKYKDILGNLYEPLMKKLKGIVDATTPATF